MPQHEIIAAARELAPFIAEQRAEGDKNARLTRDVVSACGQAGFFRMAAPKEVGGLELHGPDIVEAVKTVSAADPAVGWYMLNSMAVPYYSAFVGENERNALFENPDSNFGFGFMPGGQAVPEEGGYRFNGFWPVLTGGLDASWVALVGLVMDGDAPRLMNGEPDVRTFLLPTKDLQIQETWNGVSAMRGTASNAVRVENCFVPEGFVISDDTPLAIDRAYFREPVLAHIFPADAAVILGIMQGALDAMTPLLGAQLAAVTGELRRDQTATQELIVKCTYALRSAHAALREQVELMSERMSKGQPLTAKERAEFYGVASQIFEVGREFASDLFAGGTRDAFVLGHPLEAALKDLHAIAYARSAVRFVVHSSGRVLLGGEHDHGL